MYQFVSTKNNIAQGQNKTDGSLVCRVCMIYAGESSYNYSQPHLMNPVATFFYRSYNRIVYKRTSDINYFEYRGVNLEPSSASTSTPPWQSILTTDHAGSCQTWAHGDGENVLNWFSLMRHYKKEIPYHKWEKYEGTHRPIFYLNTCNHLFGEDDSNPTFVKHLWNNYPIQSTEDCEVLSFSQEYIPTKWNLYSLLCCCCARNGGEFCDGLLDRRTKSCIKDPDTFWNTEETIGGNSKEVAPSVKSIL